MSFAAAFPSSLTSHYDPADRLEKSSNRDPFVCREEITTFHPSAAARHRVERALRSIARFPVQQSAAKAPDHPVETSLRQADELALSLRSALERIAIPLGRAATEFARQESWCAFGFARLEDHARERFRRSGRWVKDCASLGRALGSLPLLGEALTGEDGGRPIGRVAALLVSRVASADSLGAWVDLARKVSLRDLRDAVRAARAVGSEWPAGNELDAEARPRAASSDVHLGETDALSNRSLVRIPVPAPLLAAFDETVDLYRSVEGTEATVTSFVEALVGEASAGADLPDTERSPMHLSPDTVVVESALARSTDNWRDLPASSPGSWSLALAGFSLARFHEVEQAAGSGGPADLDGQIRALIALEDDLQSRLGRVLAEMAERGAWPRLRFAGVGHYAEDRLGVSRTTAEDRVRAVRALRSFPLLRSAYEQGRIGLEATLLITRILGRGPVEAAVERAWLLRAEEATVKRLRDEARALRRRGSGRASEQSVPLDDPDWHASLRREPGTARGRVGRFGMEAAERPSPDVFLRLRLPHDLAGDFLATIEASRSRLSVMVDSVPWDEPWPDVHATPSVLAARTFSVGSRRLPAWVGLLALLEDFVLTWDPVAQGRERAILKRPSDPVYARSGWRCTAPGCTSRKNLEDHHIVYRSHQGCDEMSNRTCLCRFHHERGEHGQLASCSGEAPLNILWRLGRKDVGVWFRNERRVDPATTTDRHLSGRP
jgi:hypothetical protein